MKADRFLELYEQISEAPDTIARLRRFVLDLAVRGKLVEQDPADEPAVELLKKITAERKRLFDLGAIKKPKKLPAIENAPYPIPVSWRWVRMRDATSDRGQTVPDGEFTYIDVSAINKEAGVVAKPKVLTPEEAPSRARKIAHQGDVIYSCVRPYLLNVAVLDDDFAPAPIASTAFAILNGYGLVLPWYLWIALRSPFMVECVEQNQRGQAYPAINDKDFSLLPLPLPPLAEQQRIVAKVDELMALCDRLEEAHKTREETRDKLTATSLARLTAPETTPEDFPAHARFALDTLPALTSRPDQIKIFRQTILNLAVRGKLVEQNLADESSGELLNRIAASHPKKMKSKERRPVTQIQLANGWSVARLDEIASFENGDRSSNYPSGTDIKSDGIPFFSTKNLTNHRLHFTNLDYITNEKFASLRSGKLQDQDILITLRGSVGKFGLFEANQSVSTGFINAQLMIIRNVEKAIVPYVMRFMQSGIFSEQVARLSSGSATPQLSAGKLGEAELWLPPLLEQHRIIAKVDVLMALCDRLEAALTTANTTRTRLLEALLHQALNPAVSDELEAAE